VAVVAGVFLDHVEVDPAQGVVLAGAELVEAAAGYGCTGAGDACLVAGEVVRGSGDIYEVAALGRAVS
jgi:hypothetical protein